MRVFALFFIQINIDGGDILIGVLCNSTATFSGTVRAISHVKTSFRELRWRRSLRFCMVRSPRLQGCIKKAARISPDGF